jgi:NitT/TauT family transport system permease protein
MKMRAGCLVLLLSGLAWLGLAAATDLAFVPSPLRVFRELPTLFIREMGVHLGVSLFRITGGILLSLLMGLLPGIAMGRSERADRYLSPVVYLLYPVPKIAFLPLFMLIFGLGDLSKVLMITLIILFQVMVSTRDAVRHIPESTFAVLKSMGANRLDMLRQVILPGVLPALLSSVRVSLGTALSVLFFTETFGTRHGMGYFVMDAWMRVDYPEMYGGILVLGIAGWLLFQAVDWLERRLCPWRHARDAGR